MSEWLTGPETCLRLEVTDFTLRAAFQRESPLKKLVRRKPCDGKKQGHVYFAEDVEKFRAQLRPYEPFTDAEGVRWLPMPTIEERFPREAANLDAWRRLGCPYVQDRKVEPTDFLCRATGNKGISYFHFWPEALLQQIYERRSELCESEPAKKTVTRREAISRGYSDFHFWEAAREHGTKEMRVVERGAIRMLREKTVVPLLELKKRLKETRHPNLLTVSRATRLTKGAFSWARMIYWEEVGCPFLGGKKLTVVRADAIVTEAKRTMMIRDCKHYERAEILEAWRVFRRMAKRKGIFIDSAGDTWLTTGAAWRRRKVRDQQLCHWHEKGWLDRIERPSWGSGPHKNIRYYRELGVRGISGLMRLKRLGNGRIRTLPVLVPNTAPVAECRSNRQADALENVQPSYSVHDDRTHQLLERLVDEVSRLKSEVKTMRAMSPNMSSDFTPDTIESAILDALAESPIRLSRYDLAEHARVDRGTVSNRLPLLVDAGLVELHGRKVAITPKGRSLCKTIQH